MSQGASVTAVEIARLAGVGRAAVSNWRRRHDDFPKPNGGTPTSPSFALDEVERWLARNGKLAAIPPADRVWQDLRGQGWNPASVLADAAAFLPFVRDQPGTWHGIVAHDDTRVAELLPDAVAGYVTQRSLPGGVPFSAGVRPGHVRFWRDLAGLGAEHGHHEVFEELHARWARTRTGAAQFVTPPDLARVMVASLPRQVGAGPVLDPACGTGTLLATLLGRASGNATCAGQELDPGSARIAAFRLGTETATIRVGDALTDDRFPQGPDDDGRGAAVVVCDPPIGTGWTRRDLDPYDPRWEFGLPPRAQLELAWLQHCYFHLASGGHAVVAMPATAAHRSPGRRVRVEVLRRGALREVIALPPGLAAHRTLRPHLWILARPGTDGGEDGGSRGPDAAATRVRFVDASSLDAEDLANATADRWHRLRTDPATAAEVPVVDLLDADVDLTPARHVRTTPASVQPDRYAAEAADLRAEFHQAATDLATRAALDVGEPWPPASTRPLAWRTATVADLLRGGALTLLRATNQDEPPHVQAGDVVLPELLGTSPRPAHAADPGEADTPLRRHHYLLRPDPTRLDPWFLAGFLSADDNRIAAATGTSGARVDPRRLRVPLLPLAEQRRYGRAFHQLHALRTAAAFASRLADETTSTLAAGLTGGALLPPDPDQPSSGGSPEGPR